MKRKAAAIFAAILAAVSACTLDTSLESEISDKCGIAADEFKRLERALEAHPPGRPVRAGHCLFRATSKTRVEVRRADGASWN